MKITEQKNYHRDFRRCMEQLGRMHERSKIYVDFMDYYIYMNSESPDRHDISTTYNSDEMRLFHEAYTNFRGYNQELIQEHGWYDLIGEYYEEYILASSKASNKGQFYTPRAISDLISKVCGTPVMLAEAYDPACGSARNLLDYHCKHPDVKLTGEDLDESACKMAVINFHLHGVDGVVNWIDALTREYMGTSWRIIDGQIHITDLEWICAMDDVLASVSLLQMSDETLQRVGMALAREFPLDDEGSTVVTGSDGGGLDQWLK